MWEESGRESVKGEAESVEGDFKSGKSSQPFFFSGLRRSNVVLRGAKWRLIFL